MGLVGFESRAKEDLSKGYALLNDLVSKEKQASQLSLVKTIPPELKSLLERISETSKVTSKELETLARVDPPLNLKATHLPRIERDTRESIDKETTQQIHGHWEASVTAAGLEDFRFHDLRHTFASWAIQRGATLPELKDFLGHSSLAMVMRYAHLSPEHLRSAVARLDTVLTPQKITQAITHEPAVEMTKGSR